MEFTKEKCLELYTQLTFCRAYEIVLKDLAENGKLPGMCHPGLGQEGFFVGVQAAMQPEDWLSPQWRGDAQFCLRMGAKEFTLEMLGKKDGPSGGLGGSDHIYWSHERLSWTGRSSRIRNRTCLQASEEAGMRICRYR